MIGGSAFMGACSPVRISHPPSLYTKHLYAMPLIISIIIMID